MDSPWEFKKGKAMCGAEYRDRGAIHTDRCIVQMLKRETALRADSTACKKDSDLYLLTAASRHSANRMLAS